MKHTKRPPFIFRLMLLSVFLPIFMSVGVMTVFFVTDKTSPLWTVQSLMIDLPIMDIQAIWYILFVTMFLPISLGIWLFWSGQWRLPVLVSGIVYFGVNLLGDFGYLESYTPPEKRIIYCNSGHRGSDIYCNGVYLGQTPLEMTVEELVAKVPEWTSPPEQDYYVSVPGSNRWRQHMINLPVQYSSYWEDFDSVTYAWFPWDNFRKEQFPATKTLFVSKKQQPVLSSDQQRKQFTEYETNCRYWWRLENNKSRIVAKINSHSYRQDQPFEKIRTYSFPNIEEQSLSDQFHAWVLVNVLGELTESEKNAWDRHVLKHWQLLYIPLSNRLKAEAEAAEAENYRLKNPDNSRVKMFETALDSTARLRYGLSDPPTEDECRRLLANWIDKSNQQQLFYLGGQHYYAIAETEISSSATLSGAENHLVDAAIRVMGETIRKPLIEQWKTNNYRDENAWTPLLYLAKTNHDAEYFNELARYFAYSHYGQLELLENQNEQVIPLFKTFLYRKQFHEIINEFRNKENDRYSRMIHFYGQVNNPLLEPVFREYIVRALSDPKISASTREKLNEVVIKVISYRISWENIDQNELAVWVESLPLPHLSKDSLVQKIRIESGTISSSEIPYAPDEFYDSLMGTIICIKMTDDEITRWFTENPKGTIDDFCEQFADNFVRLHPNNLRQSQKGLISGTASFYCQYEKNPVRYLVSVLLEENTPETQKVIKQIFNNDTTGHKIVLEEIRNQFGVKLMSRPDIDYTNFPDLLDFFNELPDFVLDIIDAIDETEIRSWIPTLTSCPSPKAEQILEKWTHTENNKGKQMSLYHLANWRKRKEIREQSKQLFYDLVDEKILPDDLAAPPTHWVWKNNQYVPVDNHNDN
ncbi:MAG: hypothetical protein LBC20_02790 [Planctomycetaceae bacterium]|jgi:hypothetical protein|nr:hypothetical protein [Planctomycetaceae bacterium]